MKIKDRINQVMNNLFTDVSKLDMFGNIRYSTGRSLEKSKKKYIIVSISGGRSSGLMAYILENCSLYDEYEKIYVFMNTGRESSKTIKFLKNIQDHIIKKKIHIIEAKVYHDEWKSSGYIEKTFDNLSMNGEPFEEVIKKYGLPSVETPHCTRELKINPINEFITEGLGLSKDDVRQAIGLRFDEVRRHKSNPDLIYPLFDFHVVKKTVNNFWTKEFPQYDLGSDWQDFEGNCDFCVKKSATNLVLNYGKNPSGLKWWQLMKDKYDKGHALYRNNKGPENIKSNTMGKSDQLDCFCGGNPTLFFDEDLKSFEL